MSMQPQSMPSASARTGIEDYFQEFFDRELRLGLFPGVEQSRGREIAPVCRISAFQLRPWIVVMSFSVSLRLRGFEKLFEQRDHDRGASSLFSTCKTLSSVSGSGLVEQLNQRQEILPIIRIVTVNENLLQYSIRGRRLIAFNVVETTGMGCPRECGLQAIQDVMARERPHGSERVYAFVSRSSSSTGSDITCARIRALTAEGVDASRPIETSAESRSSGDSSRRSAAVVSFSSGDSPRSIRAFETNTPCSSG